MVTKLHIKIILFALFFQLLISGCAKQQAAFPTPPPMPVIVDKIGQDNIFDKTKYLATFISRNSVVLQPQVSGQIKEIYVHAGDYVRKEAPLLLIDPSQQQANVQSAAAVAQSQQAEISQAEENLRVLQEKREALMSTLETAQSQYDRYTGLAKLGSASQQDVEHYRDELNQASSNLKAHAAQVKAQQAAIVTAQSQYQQAQAATKAEKVQLQYHRITAPFSGKVGDIPVKLGNYVQPSTQLLSITDNDPLEINISVPVERAQELKIGLPVIVLNSSGNSVARTALSFISPQVNDLAQTVLTKALIENPGDKFKADQIANVFIVWKKLPGIRIPTQSIIHMGGRDFVYVMTTLPAKNKQPKQHVAKFQPVVLGQIEGPFYIVNSGLKPGDFLIVSGIQKLADGAPVIPQFK